MTKNAIKAIPILFIVCIIIECMHEFIVPTPDYMKYLTVLYTVMSAFALPLLIFIWDGIKNNSGAGKFGLLLLGLYLVLTIVLTFFIKGSSMLLYSTEEQFASTYKLYTVLSKVQSSVLILINGFCYFCIIRLLSKKSADPIIEKVQVVAILSTVLYYGLTLLKVWVSFGYESIMYKLPDILESLMRFSIISFALMQVVDDTPTVEEVASAPAPAQVGSLVNSTGFGATSMQQSSASDGLSTTPRFRNPALEQQEAMFAQQAQQQAAYQDPNAYSGQYAQQTTYQDPNAYAGQYSQAAYQDPNAYAGQYNQTQYQDPNAYAQTTQYDQQAAYQDQSAMMQQQTYQEQPVMQQTTQTVTQ